MVKNNFLFIVYLSLLSIVGFLTTDMYLPAFDTMRLTLDTSKSWISATLSIYLAGFALAQLLWGPISDRLGKTKAILLGLIIFIIASLGIYFANNIETVLVLRVIQAIGVCAAAVCWQALVIERYPAAETNRVFATIMPLVALSPAIAPTLGSMLLSYFGWRSIFMTLTIIAVLLILFTMIVINNEKKENLNTQGPLVTQDVVETNYWKMLQSKKFISNVLIYSLCSAGFFAWLTGAPFFLKELGYNENEIGLSFIPQTITFMLGGYGYRAYAKKINECKFLVFLLSLYSISMLSILVMCLIIEPNLLELLIPFSVMALANGACYPIVVAKALSTFPNSSGKASALQNTIQLSICFIASMLVSSFTTNILLTTAWVMIATVPMVWLALKASRKES